MPIKIADTLVITFSVFSTFMFMATGKLIPALFALAVGTLAYNDLFRRSPRE